ncbi:hypothetical protein G7Z17_g3398 [Cylindrodendrum hubeiense]|uniref:Uncharacterized protein n=1 Tax=Cylindrodendrum hubeiense TaxID=595255 RepID=A0A9P5HG07_9HYPO|nr:hypothetical protein G7Z17_g3398 [Cylindrodendrum hubeiense]
MAYANDDIMETPYRYLPGSTLNLISSDGEDIEVLVTRLIMAPTMSSVVEVQMKTQNGVEKAVLKMYDRRFGERRGFIRNGSYRPHNKRAEEAFQDYIRSGKAKTLLEERNNEAEVDWICESSDEDYENTFGEDEDDDYEDEDYYQDDKNDKNDDENDNDVDDEEDSPSEWDELGEFECETFNSNRMSYLLETRGYRKLQRLQGNCVPKLISSIVGDHSVTPDDLPPFYFQPMGVLLD